MAINKRDYQTISNELDKVLAQLQDTEVAIDDAIDLYQQGEKLIKELEVYLKTAQNKITKLPKKT